MFFRFDVIPASQSVKIVVITVCIHHRGAEFAEIGEFFQSRTLTPRSEPVLSDVEGRLGGAISESCLHRKA
jgi:hypothetical protein